MMSRRWLVLSIVAIAIVLLSGRVLSAGAWTTSGSRYRGAPVVGPATDWRSCAGWRSSAVAPSLL
jgi:hypothetical protein